jgi:hypothetical protein
MHKENYRAFCKWAREKKYRLTTDKHKVEAVSQFLSARPAASFIRNVGLPLDSHPVRADLKGIGDALLSVQHR